VASVRAEGRELTIRLGVVQYFAGSRSPSLPIDMVEGTHNNIVEGIRERSSKMKKGSFKVDPLLSRGTEHMHRTCRVYRKQTPCNTRRRFPNFGSNASTLMTIPRTVGGGRLHLPAAVPPLRYATQRGHSGCAEFHFSSLALLVAPSSRPAHLR